LHKFKKRTKVSPRETLRRPCGPQIVVYRTTTKESRTRDPQGNSVLRFPIGLPVFFSRPETAAITIRHSGVLSDKLEQAKRALAYYGATLRRNQDLYAAMQAKRIDQAQAVALFAETYASFWEVATPEELSSTDAKIRRTAELRGERMRKASDAFLTRWTDEQSKTGIGSTVWSAFNAMTGFVQHDKTARGGNDGERVESRRDSNLFGINANRTHEVLSASLAIIG
jgi:hypothetical protein